MERLAETRARTRIWGKVAASAAVLISLLAHPSRCWSLERTDAGRRPLVDLLPPAEGAAPLPARDPVPTSLFAALRLDLSGGRRLFFSQFRVPGQTALPGLAAGPARPLARAVSVEWGSTPAENLPPLSRAYRKEAYSYRLEYGNPRFSLSGSFADVGGRFSPAAADEGSREEAQALAQALATQAVNLTATWQPTPALSLTTEYRSTRNDRPGDEKRGATISDASHVLSLSLGKGSAVKASLTEHQERWDPWLGKANQHRRVSAIELTSAFGPGSQHGLRLALTTTSTGDDRQSRSETAREAHLQLRPATRLSLAADYVSKTGPDGSREDMRSVSAALQLPGEGRLAAALQTRRQPAGPGRAESKLELTTPLGGGATRLNLSLNRSLARSGPEERTTQTNLAIRGGLGAGGQVANVAFALEERRSTRADGPWSRTASFHLDRALWADWKLVADSRQQISGTNREPRVVVRSGLSLAGPVGPRTRLSLSLGEAAPADAPAPARRLALEHEVAGLRLRTEYRSGPRDTARAFAVEIPRGNLPPWASSLPTAHEFEDAAEFFAPRELPAGLQGPLLGWRASLVQRGEGPEAGRHTVSLSHGSLLGGRHYLQLELERHPEGTDGELKGRPLDLERRALMLGTPVGRGLTARLWLAQENSLSDPGSHRQRLGLGLWGRRNDYDQVEVAVTRDSERWDGREQDRASITLLFARKVSEENRLHLKVGYSWTTGAGADPDRQCQVSLGYEKPI